MRWRVGFLAAASAGRVWWHRLLRPGFCHCWATRRLGKNLWLWVEWCPERLVVGLMGSRHVRALSLAAASVVIYDMPEAAPRRARLPVLPFHHCAGVVAHSLAIPGWAITPWRLACALRRRGGVALVRRQAG